MNDEQGEPGPAPPQPEEPRTQRNNPLHGVTLKAIVEDLVYRRGWQELGDEIKIHCFQNDPSVSSSLKFLRKTPWAREKVEQLYLADQRRLARDRDQLG